MRIILSILVGMTAFTSMAITKGEALEFLYSTMSLPDKTDYPKEFYEQNIESSFRAREEMPWGNIIPEREFKHFVLPVRVNNEDLDMSRPVFYEELRDRVKNMNMTDAILEVNHWCHEKVTYRPSDGRTSSPLSSVSQAIGRCGEESTFAVAALRSVGIPARQIYTPRWAHTDDNHAWVEVWADGKWHFIGACEPEPVLDLAWFNEPASRGMLMNTNVAGQYDGPEEVLLRQPLSTRINVTPNYARTELLPVRIVNSDGTPASGAKVNFCIYNYSDFYPAVTKVADKDGRASLVAGRGDMIVWATDGKRFGFLKCTPHNHEFDIVLDKDANWMAEMDFDIEPPRARRIAPTVTDAMRAENNRRFSIEDSIRNAYTSTFADSLLIDDAMNLLNVERDLIQKILVESRGNHYNIVACLDSLGTELRQPGMALLLNVTEKDRRDISPEVISDHVRNAVCRDSVRFSDEIYNRYVLSPRIENEGLRPWRSTLKSELPSAITNADSLKSWIEKEIRVVEEDNPLRLRMNPVSALRGRHTDSRSRDIFFVAAARTIGVPARIDPVTSGVQYMDNSGKWQTIVFRNGFPADSTESKPQNIRTGTLKLTFTPQGHIVDPKYYHQFSLLKITDGIPNQLDFDEDGTVSSLFSNPVELEEGQYMLITGQRLADGGVMVHTETFQIEAGQNVEKELKMRVDNSTLSVIGSLNAENIYHDLKLANEKSLLSTTGRGYYVIGFISPNHEPSAHALNDIRAVANELDRTGAKIMLLFADSDSARRFNAKAFPGLPDNVVFGIDNNGKSRNELCESLHLGEAEYPIFAVADTFNRVVWVSTGYTIGTGDQLLKVLSQVRN